MSSLPDHLQKPLAQAFAHLQKGDARRAAPLLKRVLKSAPDNADALHGLGLAEKAAGRLERAIQFLERARVAAPNNVAAAANLGGAYREAGRIDDAIDCFRAVVALAPQTAAGHRNLGVLLQESGRIAEARACYEEALRLDPGDAGAHSNLGAAVREVDGIRAALPHFDRALQIAPGHPGALFNRANALHQAGERARATADYEAAVAADPAQADAWFNLHALRFDASDPAASIDALERAVAARPGFAMARAYLVMCREAAGQDTAADRDWIAAHAPDHAHLLDSWDYVKAHLGPGVALLADTYESLRLAMDRAPADGMVLEFGVHRGDSIRFLAGLTERTVHGFDSFEGLPEGWRTLPAGSYTTRGDLPEVPDNVALHAGWFEDTLPGFVAENGGPVAFMNVDCDLYSSTVTVFDNLAERIVPGTVIVFDEYLCNPTWREDEYKAFQELVTARSLSYDYLLFSPFTKQAAVIVR